MIIKARPEDFEVTELIDTGAFLSEDGSGNYAYFWLTKIDYDHFKTLERIAKSFWIRPKQIHYAGTKDRMARTHQLISLHQVSAKKIEYGLEQFHAYNQDHMTLEFLGRGVTRPTLGSNKGNHFDIVVRDLDEQEYASLHKRFSDMQQRGVMNLYGSQRFGFSGNSHLIGRALLKGDLYEAFREILTALPEDPSPERAHFVAQIERHWESVKGQDTEIIARLETEAPGFMKEAHSILGHLKKEPGDLHGAFRKLPKKLRTLYVHAFQAYCFNRVARELDAEGRNDIKDITLLSPHSVFSDEEEKSLYDQVLAEEGITFDDFSLPSMPELVPPWEERRPLYLKLQSASCSESYTDELYEGKVACTLSFSLPKGAYATTVIEQLERAKTS